MQKKYADWKGRGTGWPAFLREKITASRMKCFELLSIEKIS
jgi:hypothetical protein